MVKEKYWMIQSEAFRPENRQPDKIYCDKKDAEVEAKRFAKKHPGQCFLILELIGGYMVIAPEPEEIEITEGEIQ